MIRILGTCVVTCILISSTPAVAQSDRSIGLGVMVMPRHSLTINAPSAALAIEFDLGQFTVDAMLGAASEDNQSTSVAAAGRFYFLAHRAASADFGLGGGLATVIVDPNRGDSEVGLLFEVGARIRAFLVPNVAITVSAGISGALYDGDSSTGIGGRGTGAAGILYFF